MEALGEWISVVGAALVVVGIVLAAVSVLRAEKTVRKNWAEIERIVRDHGDDKIERDRQLRAANLTIGPTTWLTTMFMKHYVELRIIEYFKPSLSLAFFVTTAGALAGFAGALLTAMAPS